ncbi:unnamed protein product [Symbiodinium natans]|uniref:Uncharacterized protein n=1 Tax=Symbiodinium natans TaxID=878477 RepID=A0A812ILR5_9DINO|nr:unnamed protein product [Symbiodinium natans]
MPSSVDQHGRGERSDARFGKLSLASAPGYFLLGYEGEICSSDSLVDRMEDSDVVEKLAKVLRRICDEPEEFGFRSLNLVDDEFRDNLGANKDAQQFLEELGAAGKFRSLVWAGQGQAVRTDVPHPPPPPARSSARASGPQPVSLR